MLSFASRQCPQYFAQTAIQVSAAEIDALTCVDQDGRQYAASTLKNIPFSFKVVGLTAPESQIAQVTISGPGLPSSLVLRAGVDGSVEFPAQTQPGIYSIDAVEPPYEQRSTAGSKGPCSRSP